MIATLYSLGTLATLLLTAFGVGRPIVRWLKAGDDGVLASTTWSIGLGFVIVGWLLSLLALFGAFTTTVVGAITILGSFWGLGELACAFLVASRSTGLEISGFDDLAGRAVAHPPSKFLNRAIATAFCISVTSSLIAALAPPTSPTAISHSLNLPKAIALSGSVSLEAFHGATSPRLGGAIYAWAMLFDGPVAASLVSWLFGLLLAAAAALLARGVVGRAWGLCVGAICPLVPGVAYQMSTPLDDLMMAAFATLALACWWRGAVELLSSRWFVIAGLFLGAALATKAVAVALLVAVVFAWCVEAARHTEQRHEIAVGACTALIAAMAVAFPWWCWVIAHGGTLAPIENAPATLFHLGPWIIAIAPGILLTRRLRGLHLLVWVSISYVLASLLITPGARWFAPLVPLAATIGVWVVMELERFPKPARHVALSSLAAVAVSLLAVGLTPAIDRWRVACGIESRSSYLRDRVGVFAASEVANRVVHDNSLLLSEDDSALYFDCRIAPVRGAKMLADSSQSAEDSSVLLRGLSANGVTHLLLTCAEDRDKNTASLHTLLERAVAAEIARPELNAVLPLTRYRFTDERGLRTHYQLYMLRR